MSTNHMIPYRRFGLAFVVTILAPTVACWYASPHAAQALGVPLAWGGVVSDADAVAFTTLGSNDAPGGDDAPGIHDTLGIHDVAHAIGSSSLSPLEPTDLVEMPRRRDRSVAASPIASMTYTYDDITRWASDHSPGANLIESESAAVTRRINTNDPEGCRAARLVQNVLRELALARRSDSVRQAAVTYHKLIAATNAVNMANDAIAVQDKLIAFATEAERLDLTDANPLKLRQTRLDLVDLKTEQSFGALKLRQELSRLTGRSEAEVAAATMSDTLPDHAPSIGAGEAVATALIQRHDLRAIQILCRDLNRDTLDAGRLLMGTLHPGVGLSLATAATGILTCFQEDTSDNDLHARRCQCQRLQESLRAVIRNETLQAVLDVRSAGARLQLVDEQLQLAAERLDETRGRIRIDEATPGSDLVVELEIYQLRGDRLARQMDLAVAIDDFNHALGNDPQ